MIKKKENKCYKIIYNNFLIINYYLYLAFLNFQEYNKFNKNLKLFLLINYKPSVQDQLQQKIRKINNLLVIDS